MRIRPPVAVAFAVAIALTTVPAAAQFSDAYNFIKAVRDLDVDKARKLLDAPGATVVNTRDPATGEAPIHIVIRRRDVPWLGFLLQANADINARDRDGATPLLLASTARFTEGVRILIAVRARIDLKNNSGETPLIKAVQGRDADTVKLLLDAGANPDLTDSAAGLSARQYAAQDKRGGPIAKLLADARPRAAAPVQGPSL